MTARIFTIIISLFFISCGVEKTYDYNNSSFTEGLTVTPASLSYSAAHETHAFALHFSESDLFLLSIDYSGLGADFISDMPIEANDCRQNASMSEVGCVIPVRYTPQAAGSHAGKIVLNFVYIEDASNQKTKRHELNLTGTSS